MKFMTTLPFEENGKLLGFEMWKQAAENKKRNLAIGAGVATAAAGAAYALSPSVRSTVNSAAKGVANKASKFKRTKVDKAVIKAKQVVGKAAPMHTVKRAPWQNNAGARLERAFGAIHKPKI